MGGQITSTLFRQDCRERIEGGSDLQYLARNTIALTFTP